MNQQELGIFGEKQARHYLTNKGYIIRCTNYRKFKLELDLVCEKDNTLIIVEVKARATNEHGEPWMAVTRKKQKQIIKAANYYIEEFDIHFETRFDIISIIHNGMRTEIEHIEDAFGP